MSGLRDMCKRRGGIIISDGKKTVEYVWDYKRDIPVTREQLKREAKEEKRRRAESKKNIDAVQEKLKI